MLKSPFITILGLSWTLLVGGHAHNAAADSFAANRQSISSSSLNSLKVAGDILKAEAENSEFIFPMQLAKGDFEVEFRLITPDLDHSCFQIDLGADGFVFNGKTQQVTNTGNDGTRAFIDHPLDATFNQLLRSNKAFLITMKQLNQVFTLSVDGSELYQGSLNRDTYGEVAVIAREGTIQVISINAKGNFLKDQSVPVFSRGEDSISHYRIPALLKATDDSLLIFAEARQDNHKDIGNINIVLRRSTDDGKTWGAIHTIMGLNTGDSCGNPCPVLDPETGRIHLVFQRIHPKKWGSGEYQLFHTYSDDHGITWSAVSNIMDQMTKDWLNFHPGPGHGIVLQNGQYAGRIMIPGWYVYHSDKGKRRFASTLIYSDDNGINWSIGGTAHDGSDECMVAELADGSVMMSIRPERENKDSDYRHFAISRDGGDHFEPTIIDRDLRATVCQTSILVDSEKDQIFFSYPASGSFAPDAATRRAGLSVRTKTEAGAWGPLKMIYAGRSGYSDLTKIGQDTLGIVFEASRDTYIGDIRFGTIKTNDIILP
ncbi:exo-alpha-sialidase [Coraliomargarita sp. SDUM461004]|uniref:exo-alpha-sialidase n=1 Tax=Thalassobacterium sedimentorum TaxID=3041258 RepID=A0ABU1AMW9_9BACT|nr:exo-alpha-sialidase [Coraliomargarita sp. SDUM461004]MDQ8196136.1 exo-alpha-sialidase [Coraliomargarita sp. SDUM461004]